MPRKNPARTLTANLYAVQFEQEGRRWCESVRAAALYDAELWANNRAALLRLSDVLAIVRVSKTTVYRWSRNGLFPRPRSLTPAEARWHGSPLRCTRGSRPSRQQMTVFLTVHQRMKCQKPHKT